MYTIGNKKFDNRIFVLVASIKPFVVLFHPGHLRLSFFNYSDGGSEWPHTAAAETRGSGESTGQSPLALHTLPLVPSRSVWCGGRTPLPQHA
jgi:hypothetical protein